MADSHAAQDAAADSKSNEPAAYRLVIRATIIPEGTETPPPVEPQLDRRILALVVGSVAALLVLVWIGISVFTSDPPSTRTASEDARDVKLHAPATPATPSAAAPPPRSEPPADRPSSVDSTAPSQRDASSSPLNEVMPSASRNALQTIRGTIRVSIRVSIDKRGTVVGAISEEPGPSRYFERLALEASRKWTFAPAETNESRNVLVRFFFTRDGVSARPETN